MNFLYLLVETKIGKIIENSSLSHSVMFDILDFKKMPLKYPFRISCIAKGKKKKEQRESLGASCCYVHFSCCGC